MVKVVVVVREVGKLKPDYSLQFELPQVPAVGDYLSIHRPDRRDPYGEDVIVRQVWWRLEHPETRAIFPAGEEKVGSVIEIFVECDIAIGPYSSDDWLSYHGQRAETGEIETFKVERFSVRERELDEIEAKSERERKALGAAAASEHEA